MSEPVLDLTSKESRYDRQELISWWDQSRLRAARVLVVGAGALGNELVKDLTLLGIGQIFVIDMDIIENSNLARCVFFRERDEGRLKAEVVAEAASEMNPDVSVMPIIGDVRTAIGLASYRHFDLVLGGLDNREARLHVNRCCWKAETPWIDGAIEGLLGVMRVFIPPQSACYECTLSENDFKILAQRKTCSLLTRDEMLAGKVPTTVTSASIVAGMQTQEAIKLLHRDLVPYDFAGKGVMFNGLTHDSYTVTYPCVDDCLSHDTYDRGAWREGPEGATLGDLLSETSTALGTDDVVLDLEFDLVAALNCSACDADEVVMKPLPAVRSSEAHCPVCRGERTPVLAHTIDRDAGWGLLDLTPAEINAPPNDVITGRAGGARVFFTVNQPAMGTKKGLAQ